MSDAAWTTEPRPDAPVARTRHRAGFTLTFAGLLAMTLGVGGFLWAQSIPPANMARYAWREVAGVALGLALPFFLLGIGQSLPGRAWARALAYVGLAACAAGVGAFAWLYPFAWNVPGRDLSPYGIVPYGAGVVLLGASAFMGLLDAYLEARAARSGLASADAPVTEEEILRDLEEAARKSKLSWGGMHDRETPTITLTADTGGLVAMSGGVGRRFILDDQPIGPEVQRLLSFRGGGRVQQEQMESQADALRRLRSERAAAEPDASALARAWRRARAWLR